MSGLGAIGRTVDPVSAAGKPSTELKVSPEAVQEPSVLACGYGHPVAEGAKFCGECGQPLAGLPAAEAPQAAAGTPADPRPKPEALLTPEERAERQRLHLLAVQAGSRDPGVSYERASATRETVLLHLVEDGLTAFGQVWFRGQELEVEVDGPRWEEARKWVLLDDRQQMERWKRIMFRRGPWPGLRSYRPAQFMPMKALSGDGMLAPLDQSALAQADEAEARRGRGVPALPRF
jgi:hypothetical protein